MESCYASSSTVTEAPLSVTVDRSVTREAVENAHKKSFDNQNGDSNGSIPHEQNESLEETVNRLSGIVDFFESGMVSIYKALNIGLHLGLTIFFLVFVAARCLANFHDEYFITILDRAGRSDDDLRSENTYFLRQCGTTDVTISKHHDVLFGDLDDDEYDIFIDPTKFMDEDDKLEYAVDFFVDENGKKIQYQQERPYRRRRRVVPKFKLWESPPLKPIPEKVAKRAGQHAVHSMMKHGNVMIPQILSDATIADLRDFIVDKNDRVQGTSEEFPMSGDGYRISHGIESTEHPAVIRALKEIHDHGIFAELIQSLVGDENPALSEITAITSFPGAADQDWHPDVKPDGNGVMFGRTYSHSYSLFLPLQDTTGPMGATDLCPGTHMCADDLYSMCMENKIRLSDVRKAKPRDQYPPGEEGTREYLDDVSKEGKWRAGDGALLNQQGWHRATAHTDLDSLDRVVFIVSFLKRPDADDPRQLSRGTYFHQKWLNWGSTWEDMADTVHNLSRPWNILRCLHLWKSSNRSWGYDLFTATTLRIANNQMGGTVEELEAFVDSVMIPLNYPLWLQGPIDYEADDAWQIYLLETIRMTHQFLYNLNEIIHLVFLAFVGCTAILAWLYNRIFRHQRNRSVFFPVLVGGIRSLLCTHVPILALGLYTWFILIKSSQWAIDIDSGKTLMRPFPLDPIDRDMDPGVLGNATTLPTRSDVLIGTRLDTKAIGAYRKWLDYHPGNRFLDDFVNKYGGNGNLYHSLILSNDENSKTSYSLTEEMVSSAINMVGKRHGGRFLMQNYRTGDWMILSEEESREYIHERLFVGDDTTLLGALKEETNYLFNRYRFGFERKTVSMSWNSQLLLFDLSKNLFAPRRKKQNKKVHKSAIRHSSTSPIPKSPSILPRYGSPLQPMKSIVPVASDRNSIRKFLLSIQPKLHAGMDITFSTKNSLAARELGIENQKFPGILIGFSSHINRNGRATYEIAIDGDHVTKVGSHTVDRVPRDMLFARKPISEGTRVVVHEDDDASYVGTVLWVTPDGSIDVRFDDNDEIGTDIPSERYEPLP